MDRKKLYIFIIVACLIATGAVLYLSSQDPSSGLPENIAPINTTIPDDQAQQQETGAVGELPTPTKKIEYSTPRTFPQDSKLDLSVYQSSNFKNLNDYTALTVGQEELGRDNPYQSY